MKGGFMLTLDNDIKKLKLVCLNCGNIIKNYPILSKGFIKDLKCYKCGKVGQWDYEEKAGVVIK